MFTEVTREDIIKIDNEQAYMSFNMLERYLRIISGVDFRFFSKNQAWTNDVFASSYYFDDKPSVIVVFDTEKYQIKNCSEKATIHIQFKGEDKIINLFPIGLRLQYNKRDLKDDSYFKGINKSILIKEIIGTPKKFEEFEEIFKKYIMEVLLI